VPLESDLVPYQAVNQIPAKRVLVLASHPDDEVFGCGGAILAHVGAGVPVHVVVMTDGSRNGQPAERMQECRRAAQAMGYGEPEFWSLADRALRCDAATVQRVVDAVRASGADLLYAPSPWEVHPDHRQAAAIAAEAVRSTGVRLAYYEVGAPLPPNVLLDITSLALTKQRAMQCFASQLGGQDYVRQIQALNEYRSYSLPRAVTSAEAFLLLSAAQLDSHLISELTRRPASLEGAAATASLQADAPLVSVLVRSLDRAHLQDALDSIALQTHARVEVLVIAARPGHAALPQRCGRFPLRLLQTDQALPRSRAANKGLAEAAGDYLLFLDDDDWLMPSHIARLAEVLRRQPNSLAAYTGVALVREDGTPVGQVFDLPFDSVRQLAGNLTPIHAVLFSRKLVESGCRFDESLDRLEDWDFWLQVARRSDITHLPGVSAAYRVHESSGVHQDAGPEGAATQRIYEKWIATWTAGEGAALMERAWACADLEWELTRNRAGLEDAGRNVTRLAESVTRLTEALAHQTHIAEAQTALATDRERRIADLIASTSWRVTTPFRWLASRFGRND
jgi:LmbE family N-acetylglucosaminyl deacetylase/glycosyltransferase involved in cell wall biosynthesis